MRVHHVPASVPFLRTVITALVDGDLIPGFTARDAPERLATATLYLPTRRAGRLAREVFLDVLGCEAVLLPRIVTLGAIDDDEISFADSDIREAFDVPPAFGELERRLLLSQLIGAWARGLAPIDRAQTPLVTAGPASTMKLAADLARLMDDVATRGVDWAALDGLVPEELDQYWQLTLRFLRIAREVWPGVLAAHGRIEAAHRRDRLIAAETARLTAHHAGPVIAAGSTGSMPATATFLGAIARLPHGAVVLPGLDTDLDDAAWDAIGGAAQADEVVATPDSNHPQVALHALLARFGITRRDVMALGPPSSHGREMLASEAMRPSQTTARWHARLAEPDVAAKIDAGMQRLAVITAANPEMEALAIAVAMREAHERGITAALVTPDRALARRVMAALDRWSLSFDDSGGESLLDTPTGLFARLVAEVIAGACEPATLLALLKHPLLRLGRAAQGWSRAVEAMELAVLRGTRPSPGTAGLAVAFDRFCDDLAALRRKEESPLRWSELRCQLSDERLAEARALIAALQAALAPLESLPRATPQDFKEFVRRHRAVLVALSLDDRDLSIAFSGSEGAALDAAFDELEAVEGPSGLTLAIEDYPDVFQAAFAERVVRRPEVANARLRIYGPLEARLTQSDRVILGGLIEGVWPPAPRIDPWLSRPMLHTLGLDLPERRIGLSAHDFAQLLGAPDVILSHATKAGGAPTVASRFLHRLEAVAGEGRWAAARAAGHVYVGHAEALDRPESYRPIDQPKPTPPREMRPLRMSVTEIETWLRDPYSIYAKHILKLLPLDRVDLPLSAADRGSAIHTALGDFTQAFPVALPDDPIAALRKFGHTSFAPLMDRPEARALWWPRFRRIAAWFANWEIGRRDHIQRIDAEQPGTISIPLDDGREFMLSARADRIEHRRDRTYALLDYKTGTPPSAKQVRLGLSPQLTLEAAILRAGGFADIAAGSSVSELVYVKISGNNPPGIETVLELKKGREPAQHPDEAAAEALAKLETLVRTFELETTPYRSLNLPMWTNRYGEYDDLARIKEWSAAGNRGEDE